MSSFPRSCALFRNNFCRRQVEAFLEARCPGCKPLVPPFFVAEVSVCRAFLFRFLVELDGSPTGRPALVGVPFHLIMAVIATLAFLDGHAIGNE